MERVHLFFYRCVGLVSFKWEGGPFPFGNIIVWGVGFYGDI